MGRTDVTLKWNSEDPRPSSPEPVTLRVFEDPDIEGVSSEA